MKYPYSLGGMVTLPLLAVIVFVFQIGFLAKLVFLPLICISKIFGTMPEANSQEFFLILLYWASIGFLLGLILDLCSRRFRYSPGPRPPL